MSASRRIRVVFVLTQLTLGGAEMMLWKLLSRIDRTRFDPRIVALSGRADSMLDRFTEIDVPCELLGMRPRLDASWRVLRLAWIMRSLAPDIVQGWLYHGNLAATIAAAVGRTRAPVLWNIRGTLPSAAEKNWRSSLVIRLSGALAFTPVCIINNSVASAKEHAERLGYPRSSEIVLPNGFDTDAFRPCAEARTGMRAECGLEPETLLVGLIGRYHLMKDHANFLRAAALIRHARPDTHFLLAGERVDRQNVELAAQIRELGLHDRVHLLGRRQDVPRITAALDIACSASAYGEGFANVVGEAMSCGVPCVVTDVGDSAFIVGDTGRVVPPSDAASLARAVGELIDAGRAGRTAAGMRARERVVRAVALDAVVQQYEELYTRVHARSVRKPLLASRVRAEER